MPLDYRLPARPTIYLEVIALAAPVAPRATPAVRPLVMSRKRWTHWPSRRPVAHLVARVGDARALCGRRVAGWCGVLPGVLPAPLCRACARRAER